MFAKKLFGAILCLCFFPLSFAFGAAHLQDAPFGLKWGMSVHELYKIDSNIKEVVSYRKKNQEMYSAANLKRGLSVPGYYQFIFLNNQLEAVIAEGLSKNKEHNESAFESVLERVSEKYGKPSIHFTEAGDKKYYFWEGKRHFIRLEQSVYIRDIKAWGFRIAYLNKEALEEMSEANNLGTDF